MRTFRWQFDHDDGRTFLVYAPTRPVAATRLASYLDVTADVIAPRLIQLPMLRTPRRTPARVTK